MKFTKDDIRCVVDRTKNYPKESQYVDMVELKKLREVVKELYELRQSKWDGIGEEFYKTKYPLIPPEVLDEKFAGVME